MTLLYDAKTLEKATNGFSIDRALKFCSVLG